MELAERVDDWKSLKVDSFGELLRFGTFTVVKGDTGKDSEREVGQFLFLFLFIFIFFDMELCAMLTMSSTTFTFSSGFSCVARILIQINKRSSFQEKKKLPPPLGGNHAYS